MHRAEENEEKCIKIQSFSGFSFEERGLVMAPSQEIRFVVMSLGVHASLLEPGKASPALGSFGLSTHSSGFFN